MLTQPLAGPNVSLSEIVIWDRTGSNRPIAYMASTSDALAVFAAELPDIPRRASCYRH
jgi:hypothetical protein